MSWGLSATKRHCAVDLIHLATFVMLLPSTSPLTLSVSALTHALPPSTRILPKRPLFIPLPTSRAPARPNTIHSSARAHKEVRQGLLEAQKKTPVAMWRIGCSLSRDGGVGRRIMPSWAHVRKLCTEDMENPLCGSKGDTMRGKEEG